MLDELPGIYRIDGIRATAKTPSGAKFRTLIPLEHIAYNIVLPRVGKKIDSNNYRKKIRENIRSVEFEKDPETFYDGNRKEIKINSSRTRNSRLKTSYILSAKLGHAFSNDYKISDTGTQVYYGSLAIKAAEKELKGTKYSFESNDYIKTLDNGCRRLCNINYMLEEIIPKRMSELIDNIKKGEETRTLQRGLNYLQEMVDDTKKAVEIFDKCDDFIREKSLADFMSKNLETEKCFANPESIFSNDNGKVFLKPEVAEKFSPQTKEQLNELCKKTNILYENKVFLKEREGKAKMDNLFESWNGLLVKFRNKISRIGEDRNAKQIFYEIREKYISSAM